MGLQAGRVLGSRLRRPATRQSAGAHARAEVDAEGFEIGVVGALEHVSLALHAVRDAAICLAGFQILPMRCRLAGRSCRGPGDRDLSGVTCSVVASIGVLSVEEIAARASGRRLEACGPMRYLEPASTAPHRASAAASVPARTGRRLSL